MPKACETLGTSEQCFKTLREVVCKNLSMYGYLVILSKKQSNKDIIFDSIYFDQQGNKGTQRFCLGKLIVFVQFCKDTSFVAYEF